MKKAFSAALVLVLLISFTSCKKDKGDPPVLPPAESMSIDFSNFNIAAKSGQDKGTENSSWEFAAFAAATWKVILNTTLAVPVLSFEKAIDQRATWISAGTWQWQYSATILNVQYSARLTGQIKSDYAEWKMYITKSGSGGYDDFLWFQGTSKLDGTGGQWVLNESNASPVPLIQIDWTRSDAGIGWIKYSYVKDGAFKGSNIEYGLTANTLNAFYNIHYWNGAKFSDVNVEWSTSQRNGRVKSIDYLGDDQWHCWDSNKVNAICQ